MVPKCNDKCAYMREAEEDLTQKEGKMATEARCYTAGFEDGGKVSQAKGCWKRQGNEFSPTAS